MTEAPADDNGLTQDRLDQKKIVDAFNAMRDCFHEWKPDVLSVIGDDQAENYQLDNLPPFCLYTGSEVDGYPFKNMSGSGNSWNAVAETKFSFSCPPGVFQGPEKCTDSHTQLAFRVAALWG